MITHKMKSYINTMIMHQYIASVGASMEQISNHSEYKSVQQK